MVTGLAGACLLVLSCVVAGSASGSGRLGEENGRLAKYEKLMRALDQRNSWLKNELHRGGDQDPTLNEVEDFDYYMDQKAVERAWSRDQLKRHQDYLNTHLMKLATENIQLVLTTAQCHTATRRCLDVNKMEVGKGRKSFWPNCALVHKCGHDSGCCKYPGHVCTPVESHNIDLYFLSLDPKKTGGVERLTFENHTRCDCLPSPDHPFQRQSSCECPTGFFRLISSTECLCDCDKRESKTCKKIKRGRRSYSTKGCDGSCGSPACDYGEFKSQFGRCPRKNDQKRKEKRRKR